MKQKNLKKSKPIYILISVVAAIILWVYVVTVVSTEQTESFYNIPVTFTGVESLREQNLTISEGMNTTVNLRLTGRRTLIQQLSRDTILITVDVSKINAAGEYSRTYSISYPTLSQSGGITVEQRVPQSIDIVVKDLATREIPLRTVFQGTTKEGYAVDSIVAAYDTITVTGTDEQVNEIKSALIIIDDQDLSRTTTMDMEYTMVTREGEPIDISDLQVDAERVSVTINVVKFKEVPLVMAFNPGGGATDANVDWTAEPPTITVSGEEEALDQLNYILLGTQNLSALVADTVATYPIVVPDGLTNETGTAEAVVSMKLNGLVTKPVRVSAASNYSLINTPDGFVAGLVTQELSITVRGPSEDISTVQASALRVVADLSGLASAAGTYKIENVAVYLDGHPNSGILGSYNVMVTLMTEEEYLRQLEEQAASEDGETAEDETNATAPAQP